jgi:acyl-coenzyme A synthetase/AMP-(fatty) acid ligase
MNGTVDTFWQTETGGFMITPFPGNNDHLICPFPPLAWLHDG